VRTGNSIDYLKSLRILPPTLHNIEALDTIDISKTHTKRGFEDCNNHALSLENYQINSATFNPIMKVT
jgi:hypothetical protein